MGYKDDLGNPPLLVVSDLDRIEIHTNFTGLSPIVKLVTLDDLAADDPSDALQLLRDVFTAPEELRPRIEPAQITEQAAAPLRGDRPEPPLARPRSPSGSPTSWTGSCSACSPRTPACCRRASSRGCRQASKGRSDVFTTALGDLFAKMSKDGGLFGTEEIDWFNGGLFDVRRRPAADRLRDHDAPRGQPAQLGAHRARDLRHPVRARPGPRPARPARRPLHRPRRRSGASSSR